MHQPPGAQGVHQVMERMSKNQAKKSNALVYKPYLKGRWASRLAARRGVKVAAYVVMGTFLYFFLGQLMALDLAWLRILINLGLVALMALLYYSDGARMGESDAAFAEIALTRQQEGKQIPSRDLDRCFHPAKGFFTLLMGALPFILLCLIFVPLARPATYSLGALPSWVEGYESRADIRLALAYYHEQAAMTFPDILRLVVRLLVFPFVNMVGPDHAQGILWVERMSPLLVLAAPLFYGFGYQRGVSLRARVHGGIAKSQRRKRRQEERQKGAARQPRQLL